MDLAQLKDLLKIVAESDVAEVEIEEEGSKVVVRKSAPTVMMQPAMPPYGMGYMPMPFPAQAPAMPSAAAPAPALPQTPAASNHAEAAPAGEAPPAAATANQAEVRAPIVGTFYSAPAPDADPFVSVGDQVKPGDVLCIIEAMKLMNEIECEVAGTVRQVLVDNAEPVEYDQPLFVIEKD